jgi:dTDP-4-amino-4,6-dideoxy-D-galactose acyltransferase
MTVTIPAPEAQSDDPCDVLSWDSEFWGFPVARVRGHTLTPARLACIDRWCEARSIACLYFLATFDDPTTVRCAEDGGFRLVDVRVTATVPATRLASSAQSEDLLGVVIRPAIETDVDALRGIARESFRTTRYYFDPHFPRTKCGLLYERWIAESCRGFADAVFVADMEGTPVGYITCHLPAGEESARIGLLNVASQARRRGIGRALMQHLLDWFAQQQVQQVTGVTQARNVAIQALHDRCGFVTRSMHLWYHKWYRFPEPGSP